MLKTVYFLGGRRSSVITKEVKNHQSKGQIKVWSSLGGIKTHCPRKCITLFQILVLDIQRRISFFLWPLPFSLLTNAARQKWSIHGLKVTSFIVCNILFWNYAFLKVTIKFNALNLSQVKLCSGRRSKMLTFSCPTCISHLCLHFNRCLQFLPWLILQGNMWF